MKPAAFLLALAAIFAAAFGIGRLSDDEPASAAAHAETYRLDLVGEPTRPGPQPLRFRVLDHHGDVITGFATKHEKKLHLIVVDTGYTGFQHLHPVMAANGTWSAPAQLAPGTVRLYADFREPGGEDAVARTDLHLPGTPGTPVVNTLRTQQVDGYTVTVLGDLRAGDTSRLTFEISRDGRPVTDLQPYLGAYGHLVMLRKADGAYLHVHPEDGPPGPRIDFAAHVPGAARYHLYLDFRAGGVVRTAQFVLDAAGAPAEEEGAGQGGMGHGDH